MDVIFTTLERIRSFDPCKDKYKKLVRSLGKGYRKDIPVTFRQIYESNGYEDTLWCLRTVDKKYLPLLRHFAVDCAERVKHLMKDARSIEALKVTRHYANGKATEEELRRAAYAAWEAWEADATDAARAARAAAWRWASWSYAAIYAAAAAWKTVNKEQEKAWQMERWFEYCRLGKRPEGN